MKNIPRKETAKFIEEDLNSLNVIKGNCFAFPIDKGIESKNYLISVNDKNNFKYILKIYSENNVEELKYEIEILTKLNSVVRKKYFPVILNQIFYINEKPSVLLGYIAGNILLKNNISSLLIKRIAKKQAEMHYSLNRFKPRHKKNRFSIFDFSFVNIFKRNNNSYAGLLMNEVSILKQESKLFSNIKFKKSIIHEDLILENIVVSDSGSINFIDFGESHRAEIISDIAIAIKELIIINKGVDLVLIRDFLDSYQKITNLSKDEISVLLFLLKRRTVFMLAYFLNKQMENKGSNLERKIFAEVKALKVLQKNSHTIEKFINEYKYV